MPPIPSLDARLKARLPTLDDISYYPRGRFPLMALPREIRDEVYRHYFSGHFGWSKGKGLEILGPCPQLGLENSFQLDILHVCHRIRAEAGELLREKAIFIIHLSQFIPTTANPEPLFPPVVSQAKMVGIDWELNNLDAVRLQASAMNRLAPLLAYQSISRIGIFLNLAKHPQRSAEKLEIFVQSSLDLFAAVRNVNVFLEWPHDLLRCRGGSAMRDALLCKTVNVLSELLREKRDHKERADDGDCEKVCAPREGTSIDLLHFWYFEHLGYKKWTECRYCAEFVGYDRNQRSI